jgi:hypothetical protein
VKDVNVIVHFVISAYHAAAMYSFTTATNALNQTEATIERNARANSMKWCSDGKAKQQQRNSASVLSWHFYFVKMDVVQYHIIANGATHMKKAVAYTATSNL